jgi:hypothetical protein
LDVADSEVEAGADGESCASKEGWDEKGFHEGGLHDEFDLNLSMKQAEQGL